MISTPSIILLVTQMLSAKKFNINLVMQVLVFNWLCNHDLCWISWIILFIHTLIMFKLITNFVLCAKNRYQKKKIK